MVSRATSAQLIVAFPILISAIHRPAKRDRHGTDTFAFSRFALEFTHGQDRHLLR
jgi:hypothetical protein